MTERPAIVTCARCRVAMPADKIGMADRCVDPCCPLMPRNRGPWSISAKQAAARDVEAERYIAGIINRCIVPGMPTDTIVMKLALRGIGHRDVLRLVERANG